MVVQIIRVDSGNDKKRQMILLLPFSPHLLQDNKGVCVCVKLCIGLSCVLWVCKAKS